ncbi:hypothetical protein H6G74_15780 [Nostoc spongiaeforme FACHB-130]|uniref:Uncharacterized protein n=1 Tax=Nostoc spongiaeforme FACHB-130 TaxID=1357510 RepID=A0ABR8FWN3_9NOSO|nr:hypothetical protein [Nostoc spongiaeforme]MBD2595778.1 hypothetical protein [Nostoc spongiaeforme FACHB-130]
MISVASVFTVYLIQLSSTCQQCAETASNFNHDQLRVIAVLLLLLIHCMIRGIRDQAFPSARAALDISLFWAGNVLTLSLVYRALTTELLFRLVDLDGVVTMGIGAIMTLIAGFNNDDILADFVMVFQGIKSSMTAGFQKGREIIKRLLRI